MTELGRLVALNHLGLTGREYDVLLLVADGWSNFAAGAQLGVSPETVKTHVSHITSKLGARNRAHAVTICFREGALT